MGYPWNKYVPVYSNKEAMRSRLLLNRPLEKKYKITSWLYDILDYPWELQYRRWRPKLVGDVHGNVLEIGVGTGHNLKHYSADVNLKGIDLSEGMLKRARKRAKKAICNIELTRCDAVTMEGIPSNHYDWVIGTFICCVMPDELQPQTLQQITRVLKPGGHFKLVEIIYSKNEKLRKKQKRMAGFVEKIYGARFDRNTLKYIKNTDNLEIENTSYLKDDTYLLIEGRKTT